MLEFYKLKEFHIRKLEEHIREGKVDREIIHIIKIINQFDAFFTTSSCAGRIVLIRTPDNLKKQEKAFIFKSHQVVKFDEVWNILLKNYNKYENIWFKQEPFIIHVVCKNLKYANILLKISSKVGLKHSGIISLRKNRVITEIIGNEKIETIVSKNGKLLLTEEYLKELVNEANKKLLRSRVYMGRFYYELLKLFNSYNKLEGQ